jgi:hypothetical protein
MVIQMFPYFAQRENRSREQTKIKTCPQEDLFLYSFSKKKYFLLEKKVFLFLK